MADSFNPETIAKHRRQYWVVGGALFFCTALTMVFGMHQYAHFGESLDFGAPGIDAPDVAIGLLIATFKCSLVALIFMHLNHERGLIYKTLLFTVCFFAALMGLTMLAHFDPVHEVILVVRDRLN
jgi:caa(3)-type oxidase subunit IV